MANQHIEIQGTAGRLSAKVRQMIDNARMLQEQTAEVNDIVQQVSSGGDWASLGTYLGITEANAEAVYNLISAFVDDVNGSDYNALIDRLG